MKRESIFLPRGDCSYRILRGGAWGGDALTLRVSNRDGDYPDAGGQCVEKQEKTCHVGGCSGQLCSEIPGLISTCEWLPPYACYNLSQCGAFGDNGACGWKMTPELVQCLSVQGN